MPKRIRSLAFHPDYGVYTNARAYTTIEAIFNELPGRPVRPLVYKQWPRWKRCSWLALHLPKWKFKVFRESKKTRASHSLFWKEVIGFGGVIPAKKLKAQNVVPKRLGGAIFVGQGQAPALNPPRQRANQRVRPQRPQAIPIDPLAGWDIQAFVAQEEGGL